MDISKFEIGVPFLSRGREYICTDIGTRVVVGMPTQATLIEDGHATEMSKSRLRREGYFDGPPYRMEEMVFDEERLPFCEPV